MVARRYLRAKRADRFVSLITGFSFVGIALGVATLIIVMSVMNGFRHELLSRILGLNGHINVYEHHRQVSRVDATVDILGAVPGLTSAVPAIEQQALINSDGGARGAIIRAYPVSAFRDKPAMQNITTPDALSAFDGFNIIMGHELAKRLKLEVGDRVTLVGPQGKATAFGTIPRSRAFTLVGTFNAGMFEYDSNFIFMPLGAAQKFFGLGNRVTSIEVTLEKPEIIDQTLETMIEHLGPGYFLADWRQSNRSFFNALQVERNVMFLILTLIIVVAAFNIISSLMMMVKDKGRDIAIMRSFGVTRAAIMRIFILNGAMIGVVGTLCGIALGLTVTLNLGAIQSGLEALTNAKLFPAEIYFLAELPARLNWSEVWAVVIMSLGLSLLATIYPAWRAARVDPVEGVRYGGA